MPRLCTPRLCTPRLCTPKRIAAFCAEVVHPEVVHKTHLEGASGHEEQVHAAKFLLSFFLCFRAVLFLHSLFFSKLLQ